MVGQQDHDSPETQILSDLDFPALLEQLTGRDQWVPMSKDPFTQPDGTVYLSWLHRDGDLCCDVYARIKLSGDRKSLIISLED